MYKSPLHFGHRKIRIILIAAILSMCDYLHRGLLVNGAITGSIENSVKTVDAATSVYVELNRWDQW